MKRFLFLLMLSGFSLLFSLDNICLKNGNEIECKIIKITPEWIKYRKASNINGPIYNVEKSKVLFVKYENGRKDVLGNNDYRKVLEVKNHQDSLNSSINDENSDLKRKFRFFLGGGITKIVMDDWESDMIPSFMIGCGYSVKINDHFAYELEAVVSKKGGERESGNSVTELNLISIDIPVLIKAKISPKSRFYSLFGLRGSIVIKDEYKYSYTYTSSYTSKTYKTEYETDEAFSLFSAGIIGVVGYEMNNRLNLEVRGDYGITDITDDDELEDTYHDRAVWLILGIKF